MNLVVGNSPEGKERGKKRLENWMWLRPGR